MGGKPRYQLNFGRFALALIVFAVGLAVLLRGAGALGGRFFPTADMSTASATSEPPARHVSAEEAAEALAGAVVTVDAGHGGFDVGAIGVSGSHEDAINLQVALQLQKVLEDAGATVVMTRTDEHAVAPTKDEDMARRRQIIENSHSDVVVSIHMNALENDNSTSGHIVYHLPGSTRGEALADAVDEGLAAQPEGLKGLGVRSEDLYILRSGTQPCILVECGFLSNPREEELLQTEAYQQALAHGIRDGIAAFLAESAE